MLVLWFCARSLLHQVIIFIGDFFQKIHIFPLKSRVFALPKRTIVCYLKYGQVTYWYYSHFTDALNKHTRYNLNFWERNTREVWRELSKSSTHIVDAGAYTGVYTIEAAKSNKNALVYAYEPYPKTFCWLTINIHLNRLTNVQLQQLALSDCRSIASLNTSKNNPDLNSIAPIEKGDGSVLVVTEKLDNLHQNLDLIKIDVETVELRVLLGGSKLFDSNKPIVIVEYRGDFFKSKLLLFFRELGYSSLINLDSQKHNWLIWHPSRNFQVISALDAIVPKKDSENLIVQLGD